MRYGQPLLEIDVIVAGAVLLAGIALFMLWRQRRLRAALTATDAALARERSRRELADQALADTRAQVCRLNTSQQSLRDAERRRIARDLHDDMGQHLLAMTFDVAKLAQQHEALAQPLAQVEARLQAATRSLRTIVRDLRPEQLESGLQGAVQQQVEQFSRLSGIPCRLEAEVEAFNIPTDERMDAAVYRILQESLSNIARHAQASEVCIGLCRVSGSLSLTVRDNGIGLPDPPARRGCGLRGIAQRVAEAGGRFDISSQPGHGTALTMSFPIQSTFV
ncbi:sensor histidine kinase [Duganella sp. BJB488]|uniref:sensor histidine kinase n=1 Tax=unclassified Duganella TaxID=2636909 RepID=UPI000E34214E|nr:MULTISPECIES: sensor histidine kinase [unclassified Duganella]RFP11042.1 sensor histidine kinase [Duganella sp. BJB489]RFP14410.1 sensor histidine kinase [Duganella sp. BJB488]RFP30345.1 sensor histidine kinase [Duganella sp. BJB480]